MGSTRSSLQAMLLYWSGNTPNVFRNLRSLEEGSVVLNSLVVVAVFFMELAFFIELVGLVVFFNELIGLLPLITFTSSFS
jgi:hypothetical protein